MLCQFSFQNFKSYRDETTFDLRAANIPEFEESLLKQEKGSTLLPVSVIYGPNGGGKTALLQAFACLVSTVVYPIYSLDKNRIPLIAQHNVPRAPFSLDDTSKSDPTVFQVFFRVAEREYQYYLSLKEEIVYEALYWKNLGAKRTGVVFERDHQDITLGSSINRASINREVNPKMPYLSFLAINYDIAVIAEVQRWFESCVIRNYANSRAEKELWFPENEDRRREIIRGLNDLGIDITDIRIDDEKDRVYTQRIIDGKSYELLLSEESAGTQKLIHTLPLLLLALQEGRVVVVDELDAKLHPKLLRYIISLFKNPKLNTKGAQLLFTSHDLTTMKNSVFRRDEIWFVIMGPSHESEIYSLYDIRQEDGTPVKSTAAFDKQYLEGRYGADPYLSGLLNGGEWE